MSRYRMTEVFPTSQPSLLKPFDCSDQLALSLQAHVRRSPGVPSTPLAFFFVLLFLLIGYAWAQKTGEAAKIQYLISAVETQEGAKFLRNGRQYDAGAAAAHLRRKLRAAGDRVKTADDFIRLCASTSSISGEPYRILFCDGTAMDAEVFFRNKLKEYKAIP
jgi:hypothetical protein